MQRKVEFLCVVGGLVLLSFPVKHQFELARENARKSSCQNNLKQMVLGLAQYSNDFDDRYPEIALASNTRGSTWTPYGWFDALESYIRCATVNHCPSQEIEDEGVQSYNDRPEENNYVDYWLNSNVAGISRQHLKQPAFTILTGDGGDGTEKNNARFNRNSLPPNYAPARRHLGGANYSFADGHVKWLLPQNVGTAPVAAGGCTFAIR